MMVFNLTGQFWYIFILKHNTWILRSRAIFSECLSVAIYITYIHIQIYKYNYIYMSLYNICHCNFCHSWSLKHFPINIYRSILQCLMDANCILCENIIEVFFCGVRRTATEKIKQKNQLGLPRWLSRKQSACQYKRRRFNPWIRKILWRRKWQPTPVFFPGKSQGQRNLVGYSHKRDRLDTIEWLSNNNKN